MNPVLWNTVHEQRRLTEGRIGNLCYTWHVQVWPLLELCQAALESAERHTAAPCLLGHPGSSLAPVHNKPFEAKASALAEVEREASVLITAGFYHATGSEARELQ